MHNHTRSIAALLLLAAAALACNLPTGVEPTPAQMPAATAVPDATQPPVEATEPPTAAPTADLPPAPTVVAARPAACPAPGTPAAPAEPGTLAHYAPVLGNYLSMGGDPDALAGIVAGWGALAPGLRGDDSVPQFQRVDLTGDGVPEVLLAVLDVNRQMAMPPGDLLIFGCRDGQYALLYSTGFGPEGPAVNLLQIGDADGDGLTDAAYAASNCGAHTCFDALHVARWNGAALVDAMGGPLEMPYPTYTLTPGQIRADSGGIGSVGAEPQRDYAEVWTWNGSTFTRTQQIWAPPVYRYHALLDGDRALLAGDLGTAFATYRRVIDDETLQQWLEVTSSDSPGGADERAQLAAFAHYRLLQAYTLQNDATNAEREYDALQAGYPDGATGYDVAWLANVYWSAWVQSGSAGAACRQVVDAAGQNTSVQDFFNYNYGYANPFWEPDDLCPFQ